MNKQVEKKVAARTPSTKVKFYASNEDAALQQEQFGVPMAGRCTTTTSSCCCS